MLMSAESGDERKTAYISSRLMTRVSGIAVLVALMIVGVAAALHPVTRAEMYWMSPAVNTGPGTYLDWARVSTRDPHYAAYFAKRCPNGTAVCGGETNPSDVFLLRRAKLTPRSWATSILAQAQLRPPVRRDIARLCRLVPKPVRQDLLARVCTA